MKDKKKLALAAALVAVLVIVAVLASRWIGQIVLGSVDQLQAVGSAPLPTEDIWIAPTLGPDEDFAAQEAEALENQPDAEPAPTEEPDGSAPILESPEDLAGSPFAEEYARTAPNPDDWPVLIEKVKQLDRGFRGWTAEEIRSIRVPTLVIIGDSDVTRPEHAVEIFRLLGGGVPGDLVGLPASRLAVLPGTTHITLIDRTDWLLSMIGEFLDAPAPEAGGA